MLLREKPLFAPCADQYCWKCWLVIISMMCKFCHACRLNDCLLSHLVMEINLICLLFHCRKWKFQIYSKYCFAVSLKRVVTLSWNSFQKGRKRGKINTRTCTHLLSGVCRVHVDATWWQAQSTQKTSMASFDCPSLAINTNYNVITQSNRNNTARQMLMSNVTNVRSV